MEHETPSPPTPTDNEPQPDAAQLELSLRTLEGFRSVDFRAHPDNLLPRPMFEQLDAVRERLNLPAVWMSEHLFRCAIAYGAGRDSLHAWGHRYARAASASPGATALPLLGVEELRQINQQRESRPFSQPQLAQILESLLTVATAADRDDLGYWARRLASPPSPSQETAES